MSILGIDPGRKCGYAIGPHTGPPTLSGVWDLGDEPKQRCAELWRHLERIKTAMAIDPSGGGELLKVVVEDVAQRTLHHGSKAHAKYLGVVDAWCGVHGIAWDYAAPSTVKKYGTGHGHASKDDMLAHAQQHFRGIKIMDDNHADALHIFALAQHWEAQ